MILIISAQTCNNIQYDICVSREGSNSLLYLISYKIKGRDITPLQFHVKSHNSSCDPSIWRITKQGCK